MPPQPGLGGASARSHSAKLRVTGRRFANAQHWKCEKYIVEVFTAITGCRILRQELNDLALTSTVFDYAARALVVSPSRLTLIYKNVALTSRQCPEAKLSLFKLSKFQRRLAFGVIVNPPVRCLFCSRAFWKNEKVPCGKFVPRGGLYSFVFNPEEAPDMSESCFEQLPGADVEEFYDEETFCWCSNIAAEHGWKWKRLESRWTILITGLFKLVKARVRVSVKAT